VPSPALATWNGPRADRIDELLGAHRQVGGSGPGRRTNTRQLNWSLVLRLAGEFQGYSRDLHDLAVDHFVGTLAPHNPALASALGTNLTANRQLDRGNAQPGSLGNDFGRLGFQMWPALVAADRRAATWRDDLEALNKARNAIAHAEDQKLAALAGAGYPMWLRTVKRWRGSLNGLTQCMDAMVASSLSQILGTGAPW
jgi:hypothetical protein